MSLGRKILLSTLGITVLIILTVRLYLDYDLPSYEGVQHLEGLADTVEVFTDPYGMPHVFARNERDLFYTAGYLSAGERLFQMSVVASASRGELARFFGDDLIPDDIYIRTWRIPAMAKKLAQAMDPETHMIVEDFCAGINARIDELGNDLPIEFKILGTKPVRWTPSDVTGYERLMAHDLQQSWKPEILFGTVLAYLGLEKTQELLPPGDSLGPVLFSIEDAASAGTLFSTIWERETSIRKLTGTNGSSLGSNNWVISGSRTRSGKPILANDPHLEFMQPAKWYEMHLKGGRFNVSGVCLAGIPVPIIGQNESCAWGFTNVMADDIDFFIETIHPEDKNIYRSGDQWLDMTVVRETIPLKNGDDTTVTVRLTHHGPVISDLHSLLKNSAQVVSMSWTGHQASDEITALVKLSQIKNWDDFTEAVKQFSVPGQNMVYADTAGNIGWRPAVKVPIRKDGESLLPRPGSNPDYDWKGSVPFEEMPFLYNPPEGLIVTANHKTVSDDYPHYISNLWADASRARRIWERLESLEAVDMEDVKATQLDWLSLYARDLSPWIVAAATGNETGNVKTAYAILRDWNGEESPESAGALVFHTILNRILHNVYEDELSLIGDDLFAAYTALPMIPHRNISRLIREGTSSWFDDVKTPNYVETREDIISRSVHEAIAEIEKHVGTNPALWAWGAVHTLTHPHALGSIKILDSVFNLNVGPYPSGGSWKTINNGGYKITEPFKQNFGPSMRRIVDFSVLDETQFILPTGQSGLHKSPHYRDQAEMYRTGQYRTTNFDETSIRQRKDYRRLVLLPVQ